MEEHLFTCQCTDFGHVVQFMLDPDHGDVELFVQLNRWQGLWGRLAAAFRFVFLRPKGYRDAHYDCTSFREEDFDRLHALLDRAQARRREIRLKRTLAGAIEPTDVQRWGLGLRPTAASQGNPCPGDR